MMAGPNQRLSQRQHGGDVATSVMTDEKDPPRGNRRTVHVRTRTRIRAVRQPPADRAARSAAGASCSTGRSITSTLWSGRDESYRAPPTTNKEPTMTDRSPTNAAQAGTSISPATSPCTVSDTARCASPVTASGASRRIGTKPRRRYGAPSSSASTSSTPPTRTARRQRDADRRGTAPVPRRPRHCHERRPGAHRAGALAHQRAARTPARRVRRQPAAAASGPDPALPVPPSRSGRAPGGLHRSARRAEGRRQGAPLGVCNVTEAQLGAPSG